MMLAVQTAPQPFDVPAGPTRDSVNRLAAQAEVDIVITADLSGRRSPRLRGRLSVDQAFERILQPQGLRAVRLGDRAYRIEAAPVRRAGPAAPAPVVVVEPAQLDEVVITAPVRRGGLEGANGRSLVDSEGLDRAEGRTAAEAVADLSASVDSTRQGPGRNKLFIRGVADSAFNGPLQATVGQYLGDLRLTYGSPDPDLVLVDVRRIEVFEGPQSSRFGSGSIGGVVRTDYEPPVLEDASGAYWLGASATSGGEPGADAAIVLNQPLGGEAAARIVAYARRDGGFIDNPVRRSANQDQIDIAGVRASLRVMSGGWTVDGLALAQQTQSDDAQTVDVDAAGIEKRRRIAEPYDSGVALAGVVASRRVADGRFTLATSVSRQRLDERFDATTPSDPAPAAVDRSQIVTAFSGEARWEMDSRDGWSLNGGAALAAGETQVRRARRPANGEGRPEQEADLDRQFADGALFGELVVAPAPSWRVAAGGRLSMVRASHEVRALGFGADARMAGEDRTEVLFAPTLAARWTAPDGLQLFGRLEQGVRPGSVGESRGALERFRSDRVTLVESGVRFPDDDGVWTAEVSAGFLDWRDVQADVVTQGGDLITANVGDGTVRFVQARGSWLPHERFAVSGGLFLNNSRLSLDGPNVIGVIGGDIPNVARSGAQLSLDYDAGRLVDLPLQLGADLRYVGPSRPGLGPGLDVVQGGYVRADLAARLGGEAYAWTLRVSNPLDAEAVRYGVGSPYQLSDPQGAPLRPLTVRLGFEAAF